MLLWRKEKNTNTSWLWKKKEKTSYLELWAFLIFKGHFAIDEIHVLLWSFFLTNYLYLIIFSKSSPELFLLFSYRVWSLLYSSSLHRSCYYHPFIISIWLNVERDVNLQICFISFCPVSYLENCFRFISFGFSPFQSFPYTHQPLYNTISYNTVLYITRFKDGSQKCIDYIEKWSFLYTSLKNGTYYVTGYGVRLSVKFFVSG